MRGLDFRDLTHVVNFELPGNAATYAHRAGRCGRMGFNGIVISLASGGYQNNRPGTLKVRLREMMSICHYKKYIYISLYIYIHVTC